MVRVTVLKFASAFVTEPTDGSPLRRISFGILSMGVGLTMGLRLRLLFSFSSKDAEGSGVFCERHMFAILS